MMLKILHLAHRHVSVSRLQVQLEDGSSDDHTWVFVGTVTAKDQGHWSVKPSDDLPEQIRRQHWDAIVVHRMRHPTPRWILSMPKGPFILWASWGDDYFRVFPALSKGIHLPKSRLLLGALLKFSVPALGAIQYVRSKFLPGSWKVTPRDFELEAMGQVDAIANLFGGDFIAKPHLPKVPQHLYHSWYNAVPKVIPDQEASRDPNGPVLLGSKASTTGNHCDFLMDHGPSLRKSGRELRIVLAYGSKRYGRAIRWIAHAVLNGKVECLMERCPLEEYYAFLAESPVVVHNHIRNQNTGNVVLSFLMGQRVLLRSDGFAHRFFSDLGFIIGDASAPDLDLSPLDEAGRQHNRSLALATFNDEVVMARYDRFIEDVLAHGA
ncbi:hypothetical protein N9C70_05045 [Flavobacteriales bacterium]|nr:hypothetical protein [Flavobacteriales bacterium]